MSTLPASASMTAELSLEEVLVRLCASRQIDGVLLMGSAAEETLQPHSDYDLVVVMKELPAGLMAINTFIDQRFAEIFFYSVTEVGQLATRKIVEASSHEDWRVNWVRNGKIICDRSGALGKLKTSVLTGLASEISSDRVYAVWHKASYNLSANRRYWSSGEETYLQALDIRLHYSAVEAFTAYFTMREILWHGEKAAVEWLRAHDPPFLDLFQRHVKASDRSERMATYEDMVAIALQPVGGPWGDTATTPSMSGRFNESQLHEAIAFWDGLVGSASIEQM